MSKGLRYNKGKLPIHLVPPSAIKALAEVLDVGQQKYAPRNWEKGFDYSIPYACAMRHLLSWWGGEDIDKESGKHHLKHVLTNIAFLIEFLETHPELDDRPIKHTKENTEVVGITVVGMMQSGSGQSFTVNNYPIKDAETDWTP